MVAAMSGRAEVGERPGVASQVYAGVWEASGGTVGGQCDQGTEKGQLLWKFTGKENDEMGPTKHGCIPKKQNL